MSESQESMSVTVHQDGRIAHIELSGELDLHSSGQLTDAVTGVLADAPRAIDIDARGLSFADSAGLRALLEARNAAEAQDVVLRVARMSDPLDRLLQMTGLRDVLGTSPT
jgi:anti-sigma B factor antagonist